MQLLGPSTAKGNTGKSEAWRLGCTDANTDTKAQRRGTVEIPTFRKSKHNEGEQRQTQTFQNQIWKIESSILWLLGVLLSASWVLLGASWLPPGASWCLLGASWGVLAASWGLLGTSWEPLGCLLGPLGGLLGASWELLGASWKRLGRLLDFWLDFGSKKGAQREAFWEPKRSKNRSKKEVQIQERKSHLLESSWCDLGLIFKASRDQKR